MHGWYGYGWVGMILGTFILLAIIVGVILLIVWAARRSSNPAGPNNLPVERSSAKETLQIRYARGEITREQYLQMLADIEAR